jgi:hypothetical protein
MLAPAAEPINYYALEYHPSANLFPIIEGEEFDRLVESIKEKGLLTPITLYRDGGGKVWICDGRNRHRACLQSGYKFTDKDFVFLAASLDPEAYSISANMDRRQLDTKGKRALIATMIELHPSESDRALAKRCSVDPKTVSAVRAELQRRVDAFCEMWDTLNPAQRREFLDRKQPRAEG